MTEPRQTPEENAAGFYISFLHLRHSDDILAGSRPSHSDRIRARTRARNREQRLTFKNEWLIGQPEHARNDMQRIVVYTYAYDALTTMMILVMTREHRK